MPRNYSAAGWGELRFIALLALSMLISCQSTNRPAVAAGQEAGRWREAIVAGVRAVPLDSLCSGHCTVVVIDTAARSAPNRESLDIIGLPLLGYVSTRDFNDLGVRTLRIIPGTYLPKSAASDTVRVAASLVRPGSNTETVVLVSILLPGSLGMIGLVELRQDGSLWHVNRVRLLEA